MSTPQFAEWPHLLADLVAKRDALTQIIASIQTHFVGAHPTEMPESPIARPPTPAGKKRNKQTNKQTKQAAGRPAARSLPDGDGPRPRLDLVPARDEAIRQALKTGPKQTATLLSHMPQEPGQTNGQREDALRNALTRMKLKKQIRAVDQGWALC